MAKKPSSSKKPKRAVENSAVKGGGIMSINKSNTSPFMKGVIIVIIIAMVSLFLVGGYAGFVDLFRQQPKPPAVDPQTALKNKYDPQTQAFTTALASNPASYTLLVGLGNAHYDYAFDLMKLVSSGTTSAMLPAVQQWTASRDAFAKAYKLKKNETGLGVDYAVATFYSGDTTSAIKIATNVTKIDPNFAPAYYNLGIFYDGTGNTVLAIASYQKYLALDPAGKSGSPSYARQRIKALGGSDVTGTAPPTGSSATTP